MPDITLYDTMSRSRVAFAPLDPSRVRMYVCGPTVYDFAHIGNARPVIVFDVLFRLLRHVYGPENVFYARNLTDVDDKINKRAFERWTRQRSLVAEIRDLTESTAAQFHKDVAALGCLPPTSEPRATDYICRPAGDAIDMVAIIERLIARGHAYVAEGHVLFHVPSMPDYGRLARRSLDDMIAGARVDVAPYKKDPMDFVLWKPSDPAVEPGWESPWGLGRPGWHIECSAMSAALLGEVFDIHGGGIDLVFPHHENEIAQSCCAFGTDRMAQVWMHNGFLMVEGEKMSKSLGNFITIDQLLSTKDFGGRSWDGEVIRFAMLKTHYRQPIDWTVKALEEAEAILNRWYRIIGDVAADPAPEAVAGVAGFLADDLNTSQALHHLHEQADAAHAEGSPAAAARFKAAAGLLGLLGATGTARRTRELAATGVTVDEIEDVIRRRLDARKSKDWVLSDQLRDALAAKGIRLKDGKDPQTGAPETTWEVAG